MSKDIIGHIGRSGGEMRRMRRVDGRLLRDVQRRAAAPWCSPTLGAALYVGQTYKDWGVLHTSRWLLLVVFMMCAISGYGIRTADMIRHDASVLPVYGTLAADASKAYSRLPDSLQSQVREELWNLGLNSAGLAIRFRSDATDIGAQWVAYNKFNMNHMTATGIRGLDLYVMNADSTWATVAACRPVFNDRKTATRVMTNMSRQMREYMLYLPLYDGVDSIFILTDSAAVVELPAVCLPYREKPVVIYGTSLTQGGCATRPGMAASSILQRLLNRDVVNLGFSGNGRLDAEIARLMASADAGAYVIDAMPNCTDDIINERLETFYQILRQAHKDTPIIFVESPMFPGSRYDEVEFETLTRKNALLRSYFEKLSATDAHLYYMDSSEVFVDNEATVDNYHYTDSAFDFFGKSLYNKLITILK